MVAFNLTPTDPVTFILGGIPGLEAAHIWISISFAMLYIVCLLENFMLFFVVAKEQTLHKPMYLLLCMLVLTDIGISTCVMPRALCIFWFNLKAITLDGCLTQMFFHHTFNVMHTAVLVIMAFDRYVAICDPLRYATILTNSRLAKLVLVGLIRAIFVMLPIPLLLHSVSFCANRVIPHTHCEYMSVVKMSCADTTLHERYGMVLQFVISVVDLTLIGLSYGLIFRALLKITSKKAYQKALNTCTAHLWVMFVTYIPFLFYNLSQKLSHGSATHVHILFANYYIFFPLMFNPIIYGVKTKEFREKLGKYICRA